ncbi:MAG: hypothetical protein RL701_4641 [Pseudomonadota bacterium]|jgi:hypothetical protein
MVSPWRIVVINVCELQCIQGDVAKTTNNARGSRDSSVYATHPP